MIEGSERFIATDGDEPMVELSIRPAGKPEDWGPTLWAYKARAVEWLGWRMDMSAAATQLRYGPGASQVTIGGHPELPVLHDLDLGARGVIGSFHTDGGRVIEAPPFDVGPALAPPDRRMRDEVNSQPASRHKCRDDGPSGSD